MEQARYWMWAKRKPDLMNPHHTLPPPAAMNSYGDSWEEQAFAEDAAGTLGGCVWPPRSYSCSFCRREFRSAQALGGHMNVHRRDRARLKQSPIPPTHEAAVAPQIHALNTCTSFDPAAAAAPYSSALMYNSPKPGDQFSEPLVSIPSHAIRVSSPPAVVNNKEEKTSTLCFFSPQQKDTSIVPLPPPRSWSSFVAEKRDRGLLDSIKNEVKKITTTEKEDCVTEEVSLNLVVCRTQTSEEEVASCKRRRIEAKPLMMSNFFPKLSPVDRCLPQSDVFKLRSGSGEELDLELRLGDAPKVK